MSDSVFLKSVDSAVVHNECSVVSLRCPVDSYLLGLLAMIKCSICSYQYDNWYSSDRKISMSFNFFRAGCSLASFMGQADRCWARFALLLDIGTLLECVSLICVRPRFPRRKKIDTRGMKDCSWSGEFGLTPCSSLRKGQ